MAIVEFDKQLIPFGVPTIEHPSRIYQLEDIDLEYLNKKACQNTVMGQLGPDNYLSVRSVSHIFLEFYIKDGWLWGKGKTLLTPMGEALSEMLNTMGGDMIFRPFGDFRPFGSNYFVYNAIPKKEEIFQL